MAKQPVKSQKRRGPLPTGKGEPVMVRIQPAQLAALDAWIARHPDPKPTRPEAIRRMMVAMLTGERLLPSRPELRKRRQPPLVANPDEVKGG
jgi:hypothetical protein